MTLAGPVDLTEIFDRLPGALIILFGILVLAIVTVAVVSIAIGGSALVLIDRLRARGDTGDDLDEDAEI